MDIFTKFLMLYIWLGVSALLVFLYRIAHFYQVTTGLRSHFRFFLIPATLFIAGTVQYLIIDNGFTGDVLGDLLFFLGGISLSLVGYYLLKLMTGGR
jgi:hypothetical protein